MQGSPARQQQQQLEPAWSTAQHSTGEQLQQPAGSLQGCSALSSKFTGETHTEGHTKQLTSRGFQGSRPLSNHALLCFAGSLLWDKNSDGVDRWQCAGERSAACDGKNSVVCQSVQTLPAHVEYFFLVALTFDGLWYSACIIVPMQHATTMFWEVWQRTCSACVAAHVFFLLCACLQCAAPSVGAGCLASAWSDGGVSHVFVLALSISLACQH